jgi:restriction endonuclease Mrr
MKISVEDLEEILRKVKVLHDEQHPRGDQLEIPDKVLVAELPRLGVRADPYEVLGFVKDTLRKTPRLIDRHWISYDPGLSAVTIEIIPAPERLEWLAEKARLDIESRLEGRMVGLSPKGFEEFVKDLVESGKRISVERIGQSHDGGVDFVGEKKPEVGDEFGLPVQIIGQAKRWSHPAARAHVAQFLGDVDMKPLPRRGQGQRIGIFISCSGFMDDARISARRASLLKLMLWDAHDLASLMITRRFGVNSIPLNVPVWDESFWNDYK